VSLKVTSVVTTDKTRHVVPLHLQHFLLMLTEFYLLINLVGKSAVIILCTH